MSVVRVVLRSLYFHSGELGSRWVYLFREGWSVMNERLTVVVVVGAGPTGLTIANQLARQGTTVRIIDSAPAPPITSRALVVMPRTLEIFDDSKIPAKGSFLKLLLLESVRCYRSGADIACMLCAHASCERELAGILSWQVPATPNSNRWGLGRLRCVGRERNWFGADLELRLQSVNENRRTLYPARAHRVADAGRDHRQARS
jgi:hypothetical protein